MKRIAIIAGTAQTLLSLTPAAPCLKPLLLTAVLLQTLCGAAGLALQGRALLGTAKYPQALPGAEAALQSCDWTELDEDGNSELTAEFSFSDGTLYPVNST